MIYPDSYPNVVIKLTNLDKALAQTIDEAHKRRHMTFENGEYREKPPVSGWVNGMAMPHCAELAERK